MAQFNREPGPGPLAGARDLLARLCRPPPPKAEAADLLGEFTLLRGLARDLVRRMDDAATQGVTSNFLSVTSSASKIKYPVVLFDLISVFGQAFCTRRL